MGLLYEEKVAKRFAKIKPYDFDFWEELDDLLLHTMLFNEKGEVIEAKNKDEAKLALAYIFICYGMYELKSMICAILMPQVILKLAGGREKVEEVLTIMEAVEKVRKKEREGKNG